MVLRREESKDSRGAIKGDFQEEGRPGWALKDGRIVHGEKGKKNSEGTDSRWAKGTTQRQSWGRQAGEPPVSEP